MLFANWSSHLLHSRDTPILPKQGHLKMNLAARRQSALPDVTAPLLLHRRTAICFKAAQKTATYRSLRSLTGSTNAIGAERALSASALDNRTRAIRAQRARTPASSKGKSYASSFN